jgi:hypothetical protein
MKYVQFFKTDLAGNKRHQLGSDGVMALDGRWGIPRIDSEALARARMLNTNLGKNIIGYEICEGRSFQDSRVIQPYRKLI